MRRITLPIVALLAAPLIVACIPGAGGSATEDDGPQIPISASLEVRFPPTPVRAEGKMQLVYELHITDLSDSGLALTRAAVFDSDDRLHPMRVYEGPDVSESASRRLEVVRGSAIGVLVLYVWLAVDEEELPSRLFHRVTLRDGDGRAAQIEGGTVDVSTDAPVIIGPPVRGGSWVTGNGPSNASAHRRALYGVAGAERIAQRFATDWVRTDPGRPVGSTSETFEGDRSVNSSHYAYGAEVLAVADGVVTAVVDGVPDNVPGAPAQPVLDENLGGNYIILDLDGGRFALYAHLQPRSIRVRLGDRVRRGDVLARIGNSGHSSKPHLHFHIADANSLLQAEGLPYVFESFESVGRLTADLNSVDAAHAGDRRLEMPLANTIVRFRAAD